MALLGSQRACRLEDDLPYGARHCRRLSGQSLVIAIFYTASISWWADGAGALCFLVLVVLNLLGIRHLLPYVFMGILLWFAVLESGVHSTIAGVLLAMTIPSTEISRLEHILHPWVTFFNVPLFALANAGVTLGGRIAASTWPNLSPRESLLGLLLGLSRSASASHPGSR